MVTVQRTQSAVGGKVVLEPLIPMAMGAWGSTCSPLSSQGSTETKLEAGWVISINPVPRAPHWPA